MIQLTVKNVFRFVVGDNYYGRRRFALKYWLLAWQMPEREMERERDRERERGVMLNC